MIDPLGYFSHEKCADDSAPSTGEDNYVIPRMLSRSSLDPGERALAAVASVAGSTSVKLAPIIAKVLLADRIELDSVAWKGVPPIQNIESFAHAFDPNRSSGMSAKSRFMGLFDIEGRAKKIPTNDIYFKKVDEIQPVVDSFIDKHNLKKKGVRLNIQHGFLSSQGGGSFSKANKNIFLPRVSKELALHELGHAADYTKGFGKVRRFTEPAIRKSIMVALPIALAAGDRIKEMIPGTVDDKAISFMQDNAPEIMAATLAATTLFPEAKASILALQHLRDMEQKGKQAKGTTLRAAKKLLPMWGTYVLGAIPAVVGMSLARKFMRAAREEKAELKEDVEKRIAEIEKNAGVYSNLMNGLADIGQIAKEVSKGTKELIVNKGTMGRIKNSAKHVGTSPEFIFGALTSAVPATLGALYMYGTPSGELVRGRLDQKATNAMVGVKRKKAPIAHSIEEEWRNENPLRFAGIVGLGAAMSGGIITKIMHDLTKAL